ncbi:hypothetical protein BC828DRAFT_401725 [Blastocladiella britannica]|nr:hypothetical protein BC828DRAFT_401725 [Blastocladiella britannica]
MTAPILSAGKVNDGWRGKSLLPTPQLPSTRTKPPAKVAPPPKLDPAAHDRDRLQRRREKAEAARQLALSKLTQHDKSVPAPKPSAATPAAATPVIVETAQQDSCMELTFTEDSTSIHTEDPTTTTVDAESTPPVEQEATATLFNGTTSHTGPSRRATVDSVIEPDDREEPMVQQRQTHIRRRTASRHHVPSPPKAPLGPMDTDHADQRVDRILDYLNVQDLKSSSTTGGRPSTAIGMAASSSSHSWRLDGQLSRGDSTTTTGNPVFDVVKHRLIALELECDDKARSVAALKHELQQSRAAAVAAASEHAKTLKSQLALQRKEYEAAIKRHLAFIDKTLAEKEAQAKQCEKMAEDFRSLETAAKSKLLAVTEKHDRELKAARGVWEAGEKVRRDKWMAAQAARIKEQTVKGLEPEIQRMLASHKSALALADERARETLIAERTALARSHEQQIVALRDQWSTERARAVDDERDAARARYLKQLERDEMEFQQAKRKWTAELAELRDSMAAQFRDERTALECTHRKQLDDLRLAIEQEKDARAHALDEQRRRHAHELSMANEKARAERDAWAAAHAAKVEADIRTREREFKEMLLRERDREIEQVIVRLEQESGSSSSEAERRHRTEVEALRAQHAEELKQAEEQWSVAMDKLVTVGRQCEAAESTHRTLEKEVWGLKSLLEAKEKAVAEVRRELDRYKAGEIEIRRMVEESVQEDMRHRDQLIESLRHEVERCKGHMADSRRDADARVNAAHEEKVHYPVLYLLTISSP